MGQNHLDGKADPDVPHSVSQIILYVVLYTETLLDEVSRVQKIDLDLAPTPIM